MNKRQKQVQQQFLDNEEAVIRKLKNQYSHALKEIEKKATAMQDDINRLGTLANLATDAEEKAKFLSMQQSKIYQKQYQDALKKQIGSILDNMQVEEFKTVSEYLKTCYEDGFIGTMYDMQGQGIPLCFPLDQEAMVRAIQLDSKISQGLYTRLGEDVTVLKKKISSQVSRSIATGASYQETARQLKNISNIGYNNAVRIARTEGHRVQVQSSMDACYKAKETGADVVKQWDASLDSRTRDSHARVDGEIREVDEKFSNGLMYPGDSSGGAAEVVNCRCALLQRAKWALDEDELQVLKDRAEYFGLDKADTFADYKEKYLKALTKTGNGDIVKSLDVEDFNSMATTNDITPEVSSIISNTIKEFENTGDMFISDFRFGDFYDEATGKPALFQISPSAYGLLEINVNSRLLGGKTIAEADEIIRGSTFNIPQNLREAVIHECGHAKAYYRKTISEIAAMNDELASKGVPGISKAATMDGAECIAEVEVLLSRGEKVPAEAMKLYNKYVKGK